MGNVRSSTLERRVCGTVSDDEADRRRRRASEFTVSWSSSQRWAGVSPCVCARTELSTSGVDSTAE